MNRIKVIIADDSKINNDLMMHELTNEERIDIVGVAEDGIGEYKLIKEHMPELVITDNQMPNMTGMEVIKKVSEENLSKKIHFIIVSGDSFGRLDDKLNVIAIINKPINYDRLRAVINDFADEI